jgi:methylmalonyl-CoA/ethylmalonyl-CoA epimerase
MTITLNQLGQVMLPVDDVDAAETFYAEKLGLRKLYRFDDFLFFDCAGVHLLVEKSNAQPFSPAISVFYFRVADISLVYREFLNRGVDFMDGPHLIAQMEDHDLWMAFFKDPAGNTLALMQEAPQGYQPNAS